MSAVQPENEGDPITVEVVVRDGERDFRLTFVQHLDVLDSEGRQVSIEFPEVMEINSAQIALVNRVRARLNMRELSAHEFLEHTKRSLSEGAAPARDQIAAPFVQRLNRLLGTSMADRSSVVRHVKLENVSGDGTLPDLLTSLKTRIT